MLGWQQGPDPPANAPRTGRETQVFYIAKAYLQLAHEQSVDCDLHLEISNTPDKNAPRALVETPNETSYCSARRQLQMELQTKGFQLTNNSGELPQPVVVDVRGMAFQDERHRRASVHVVTVWELHPAIVTIIQ
jgi:hypothetical protein